MLGTILPLVVLKRLTVVAHDDHIGPQAMHALLAPVILLRVEHNGVAHTFLVFANAAGVTNEQNIPLTARTGQLSSQAAKSSINRLTRRLRG
jgi:hypothetical protein